MSRVSGYSGRMPPSVFAVSPNIESPLLARNIARNASQGDGIEITCWKHRHQFCYRDVIIRWDSDFCRRGFVFACSQACMVVGGLSCVSVVASALYSLHRLGMRHYVRWFTISVRRVLCAWLCILLLSSCFLFPALPRFLLQHMLLLITVYSSLFDPFSCQVLKATDSPEKAYDSLSRVSCFQVADFSVGSVDVRSLDAWTSERGMFLMSLPRKVTLHAVGLLICIDLLL